MAVKRGDGECHLWVERDKAREGGGGKTKNSVALGCNRPSGLGVDTWTHVIIDGASKSWVWTACVHTSPPTLVPKSETNVRVLRTHTDILSIELGGVDNHKDLLNGAGCSSLYQVLLYRARDRWDCHDGWRCRSGGGLQHSGSNWNRRMSTSTRPAWAATLSDEPPKAAGEEMNGWVASFSKQWIKVAEQRCEREGKMLFNVFLFISGSQMSDTARVKGLHVVSLIPCWLLLLALHTSYWLFIPKEQTGAASKVHFVIRLF